MFAKFFTFVIIVIPVTTKLVPYIHACGRKNPNIDNCIMQSIEDLKERICIGIPELESPPLEPFVIDHITIFDSNNAKLFLKDSNILGICNFALNTFHIDLDKLQFNFTVTFPKVYSNSTYDIDIRVLLPVVHKGPIHFITDNVLAKSTLDLKIITRYGERYVYISKMNLQFDIKGLKTKLDVNELSQLNEIIRNFLVYNEEELIAKIKPSLETEVSKKIISIANNIVKHFTFNELFRDRD